MNNLVSNRDWRPFRLMAAVCVSSFIPMVPVAAGTVAVLTVESSDSVRIEAPVSALLPEGVKPDAVKWIREVRAGGEGRTAPFQFDPAEARRIWWIPAGETEAGATRKFELRTEAATEEPEVLKVTKDDKTLQILWGDHHILQYDFAPVPPPPGVDVAFTRGGYIHPLWTPSGRLVTEDHPKDHLHHKGVWFPWTHTKFEGREVDFWNLGDKKGTVRFVGFDKQFSGDVFAGFISRHEHVDLTAPGGEKVALNETWDVRAWRAGGGPVKNGAYVWDLTSTQTCASSSPLELEEYRYGGLGFRGAKEWKDDNYLARASNGKTHKNGHTTRAKWCDHAGKVDGEQCGVLILGHPENFRFPEPMRLWDKGGCFFCWSPVQLGDAKIEPGKPYVTRYRFIVHDGDLSLDACEQFWQAFGNPPKVKVEAAGATSSK